VHNCVGQVIARMEAEALLGTPRPAGGRGSSRRARRRPRLSNWLRGFASVPVRFVPA
jgi:hypothetical protein